jgi:tryptophan-rich sensory protein
MAQSSQKIYKSQKLPPLAPPAWAFGVVWPFLYVLIIISYGMVFYKTAMSELSIIFALPFVINLVANGLFTYFQFKLRNNILALIDIIIILATIVISIVICYHDYRLISYLQIPYLIWVSFATYLQIGVSILNR